MTEVNRTELFGCLAAPAFRLKQKGITLDMLSEIEPSPGKEPDPKDRALKALKEAARQLGMDFGIEG